MENQYVKQFPELMKGKTIMYVHGFGSSGQSGTVTRMRTVFPSARVVAPDLPVHPADALALLRQLCQDEQPDLIIGTSMGGMYTEQLRGFDRICINPALQIADTMQAHGMTGTQTFQNPRQDGIQTFYVDKALVKEYRQVSEQRFEALDDDDRHRVYGLFGDQDTTVDTFDLFHEHYPQAIRFHGEHRMDDHSFMHAVVPVIRWIDDRQEGRERPIIYIGIEAGLPAQTTAHPTAHPLPLPKGGESQSVLPAPSFQKAVRFLIERYQVYFVCPAPSPHPTPLPWGGEGGGLFPSGGEGGGLLPWLYEYVNVPAWGHTIFTNQRHLLYGDYLIERQDSHSGLATRLEFGSDQFKTWDDVIDYFALLGGQ